MTDAGFLFIPEHIMERDDLSLQEKCVYGRIIGLTKKEGYCYISNELLGEKLGLSGSMVSKYISSLTKKGLLLVEVVKNKKGEGAPSEWGTRRKIYAYLPVHSSPSTINGEPPSTINGEYSNTEISNTVLESPITNDEEINDSFAGWRAAKKARKQNKGRGVLQGRGSVPRPFSTPPYEKKERTAIFAEDVV